MAHFADPSEPGAHGHQQWLREQRGREEKGMSITGDGAPKELREKADTEERTLNDELAEEAARTELRARARLGRAGTKHDPEL